MKREFVPYDLAVKLKELGFKDKCLGSYDLNKDFYIGGSDYKINIWINAPLWQQAFSWFRTKYGYHSWIYQSNRYSFHYTILKDGRYARNGSDTIHYEEARQACLEKLIELV